MKILRSAYNQLRLAFDPATEGNPYVRMSLSQSKQHTHRQIDFRMHRRIVIR